METRSIAVIAYRASSSGIATFTYQLSKALALAGHEVTLPALGMSNYMKRELRESGVRLLDWGRDPTELGYLGGPLVEYSILSKKVKKSIGATKEVQVYIFTIPGFALRFYPNCFLVEGWGYLGLLRALGIGLRYLNSHLKPFAVPATLEYWLMDNKVFRKAAKIVCSALASFHFWRNIYGLKVAYIPPPVEVREVKRCLSSKTRILFVSRDLSLPRKNLSTLLAALSLLGDKHLRQLQLILVGSGGAKFRPWLEHLKLKGLDIEIKGCVNRIRMQEIYASSDILVYPSYYEELGYAVLEGMAHGLAVIASDIPSFRDMVVNGRNGILISPNDYKTLAKCITDLSSDRERLLKMSSESLRIVKEKFDPKLTTQTLKSIMP